MQLYTWYNTSTHNKWNSTIVQFNKNKCTTSFIDKYIHIIIETGNIVYGSHILSNTLTVLSGPVRQQSA